MAKEFCKIGQNARFLKYCIITNNKRVNSDLNLTDAVGFYQWGNVFNGRVYQAEDIIPSLKDGDFDIIHVRLEKDNFNLISRVRKKIGRRSKTRIVMSLDVPINHWHNLASQEVIIHEITQADFVFATEYTIANSLQEISGINVYEIPHPADISRLRNFAAVHKKKMMTVLYSPGLKNMAFFKKLAFDNSLSIRLLIYKPFAGIYKNEKIDEDIELLLCCDELDLCRKLKESELIIAPYHYANYGKLVVYAAALGCLVLGNNLIDAVRRCYTFNTGAPDSMEHYKGNYRWLKYNKEVIDYIITNAGNRVEYYNWGNTGERFLRLLNYKTGDKRFELSDGQRSSTRENIVFHNEINHLYGKKSIKYQKDELALVCLLKNGKEYINEFMGYYQRLGIKYFIFIDNGSIDGTVALLKQYKNVTIYQTNLPHKDYESEIRRTVIEEHCMGRWCLYVDIDEFFDFPFSERITLAGFLKYLDENKYTAAAGYMLDMFARMNDFRNPGEENQLIEKYCYYDISDIRKDDYFSFSQALYNYNILPDKNLKYYYGGIRRRIFKNNTSNFLLIKHPLMFLDGKIEPVTDPHFCNKASIADVSCLLKHYKFIASFKDRINRFGKDYTYFARKEYEAYAQVLQHKKSLTLYSPAARKLKSVNELIENKFLRISEPYIKFVENES